MHALRDQGKAGEGSAGVAAAASSTSIASSDEGGGRQCPQAVLD